MSEEIKELTDKEAMKILGEFATACYVKGVKDALIGVSVGGNIWSGNCGRVRSYQSVERQKEN
jgi:hypothetical protein